MQSYRCPNCGRIYNYDDSVDKSTFHQCMNCRYSLKRVEDVKTVKHPELNPMLSGNHVIGTIKKSDNLTITCSYCGSTNVKKINSLNRTVSTVFWGIASKKIGKQWHCNNCGSDF